ncbi:MAG: hypothetical protein WA580_07820 [Acidimicrobiales bacterium]
MTLDTVTPTRARGLKGEFARLWVATRAGWTNGARPWLGVALALSCVAVTVLLHFQVWRPELWRSGDVSAALPLSRELARLPVSLFMPTAYLPLWGAILQLVAVVGLGELILGRSVTVVVAAAGHVGSTLLARLLLATSFAHLIGLTPAMAHVIDTGPSGATTAVGACLLVSLRMNRTALLLTLSLSIAAVVAPGLDGVEHAGALVIGLVSGIALGWFYVRAPRRSRPLAVRWVRVLRRRRPGIVALREYSSLSPR